MRKVSKLKEEYERQSSGNSELPLARIAKRNVKVWHFIYARLSLILLGIGLLMTIIFGFIAHSDVGLVGLIVMGVGLLSFIIGYLMYISALKMECMTDIRDELVRLNQKVKK